MPDRWIQSDGQPATLALLTWFDRQRRDLPWRHDRTDYRVWLSEIMLQQTQVATVIPYFESFVTRWPDFQDLAQAKESQVLKAWEGLGYYSRARNLLKAARVICSEHGGRMPEDEKARQMLPGIGEYTAAAIGALAFGQPLAAIDGNIVRVFSRLSATAWDPTDLKERRQVRMLAETLLPKDRPGDFNEALMDLGATICLPKRPLCGTCPVSGSCLAFKAGTVDHYPLKQVRKARPTDRKTVLVLISNGKVHVTRRPAKGLLAGLWQFDWLDEPDDLQRLFTADRTLPLGGHTHEFTHRRWQMEGFAVLLSDTRTLQPASNEGRLVTARELSDLAFPTALAGYREKVLDLLKVEHSE